MTESNTLLLGCRNTVIPAGVTTIGEHSFCNSIGLTSLDIPYGVTKIEPEAFYGCRDLTQVNIPNSVKVIDIAAFGNSGLTSVTIPSSVRYLGFDVFTDCNNLAKVISKAPNPPHDFKEDGESAFIDISDNCILIVPQGSREKYIAAGWNEDVFKGGIFEE